MNTLLFAGLIACLLWLIRDAILRAQAAEAIARAELAWVDSIPEVESFCPCEDCDELREEQDPLFLVMITPLLSEPAFRDDFRTAQVCHRVDDGIDRLRRVVFEDDDE